jgi:MoaA/NifB/PqqE/SkfB family radical SAM enzyme
MVPVTHFNLETTNLCNQRCVYCFNNSGPSAGKGELSSEIWKRFLAQQVEWGLKSVHMTGGEPFVNNKAIELVAAAQELGLSTSVLSNGYRIPELVEQFEAQFKKLSVVQISLDSARADLHDARRRKAGAWRQATGAIRAVRRLGIPCEISCTVSQENSGDLKKLARFCDRLALKLIVRPLVASGRGKDTSLTFVHKASFRKTLVEIERQNPGTIVDDRFRYVPDRVAFDSKARAKGTVTVLPDGKFRAGGVFFPQIQRECASVQDMLAAA